VSTHPDADVDYLFAQIFVDRALVDTSPPCGNMVTAVTFGAPLGTLEVAVRPARLGRSCVGWVGLD
jgi:2-methylaconitate cis-trans-isomerase PrpF